MQAIASVPEWIPEDDLLLKNAVEAGASLEALAKGAVRFSRRFTVCELRDRWRSLLYDPDVSAEASARMVEYELSASGNSSSSSILRKRSIIETPAKRKAESVREQYYSMRRKKLCSHQAFQSLDLSFLDSPYDDDDRVINGGDCPAPAGSYMIGDHMQSHLGPQNTSGEILKHAPPHIRRHAVSVNASDKNGSELILEQNVPQKDNLVDEFGNSSGAEDMGPSYATPDMPIWKTIEDVSAPAMPIGIRHGDEDQGLAETLILPDDVDGEKISSSGYHVVDSGPILKDGHACGFVDLSDCLLNLANDGELLFAEEDGKNSMNESRYESVSSIPSSPPINVHEDDHVAGACETQTLVLNLALDAVPAPTESGCGNQRGVCSSEIDVPLSTSVPHHLSFQLHDEEMECTLNTEDPEIPSNDHICLSTVITFSATRPDYTEANNSSSSTHQRSGEQEISLKKKDDNHTLSFTRVVGLNTMPETRLKHQIASFGVRPGLSGGNSLAVDSKDITIIGPSQGRSAHATPKSASDEAPKIQETNGPATVREHAMFHLQASSTKPFVEPEASPRTVDQEDSEGDEDIPCFFDIEAMILEMDLCPDDEDPYISREVARYQHENTKRRIIRLEQCARSSTQRAIASRGALAILYGRHLKQYIKKAEVILGRATDDFAVDIDLGREGRANKVSRRQALIRMEEDGSFFLKNLGKSSIFLNGKEIARGQLMALNSGSLIEIREMAFVFDVNHKSVRHYLTQITKGSQVNTKFEWSPGGGP